MLKYGEAANRTLQNAFDIKDLTCYSKLVGLKCFLSFIAI